LRKVRELFSYPVEGRFTTDLDSANSEVFLPTTPLFAADVGTRKLDLEFDHGKDSGLVRATDGPQGKESLNAVLQVLALPAAGVYRGERERMSGVFRAAQAERSGL
jgi:hypothetical protein